MAASPQLPAGYAAWCLGSFDAYMHMPSRRVPQNISLEADRAVIDEGVVGTTFYIIKSGSVQVLCAPDAYSRMAATSSQCHPSHPP